MSADARTTNDNEEVLCSFIEHHLWRSHSFRQLHHIASDNAVVMDVARRVPVDHH